MRGHKVELERTFRKMGHREVINVRNSIRTVPGVVFGGIANSEPKRMIYSHIGFGIRTNYSKCML